MPSLLAGPHALAEIFQVHLVADAGARRHDAEIVERVLAPAQELVALAVALELDVDVLLQRVRRGEDVDHAPSGRSPDRPAPAGSPSAGSPPSRVMPSRIAARSTTAGTPVKSCIRMRAGLNGTSLVGLRRCQPAGDRLGVVDLVAAAVLEAQHVLQQHFQADRQAGDVAQRLRRLGQREIVVALAPHGQRAACFQGVLPDCCHARAPFRCRGVPGGLGRTRRGCNVHWRRA